ncbi:MAG: DUF3054 domain-containing protein [Chloroflexota bacterium]
MKFKKLTSSQFQLIIGDFIVLAAVTLYGFAEHGSLSTSGARPLTTLLPWFVSWLIMAGHLGLYDSAVYQLPNQLWRTFWGMVLASPIAGFLRSLWLGGSVTTLFVIIFGGIAAFAILIWRAIFIWVKIQRARNG